MKYLILVLLYFCLFHQVQADSDFYLENTLTDERQLLNVYEQWDRAHERYEQYINNNQHLRGNTKLEQEYYRLEGIRYAAELFLASAYRFKELESELSNLSKKNSSQGRINAADLQRWQHWHHGALSILKTIPDSVKENNKNYTVILILMDRIAQIIDGERIQIAQKQNIRLYLIKQQKELAQHKKQLQHWSEQLKHEI